MDNDLLDAIDSLFRKRLKAQGIVSKAMASSDTYELAKNMGETLSKTINELIDFSNLEEYGLTINDMFEDVIMQMLYKEQDLFNDIAYDIKKELNVKDGIGLNPLKPKMDSDKLRKTKKEITEATDFGAMVEAKVKEMSYIFNDRFEKYNADADYLSGFEVKVIRECEPNACDWCLEREGTYDYADAFKTGAEVWKRHTGCVCKIYIERQKRISTNENLRFR